MYDIMLDLETLGHGNNSVILSIGACYFDHRTNAVIVTFYENVDPESCVKSGLTVDVSTIIWWMQQGEEARKMFTKPVKPLREVLIAFSKWIEGIGGKETIRVWGNGAVFDNVLIRSAYKAVGETPPWSFRQDACYRTLKNLFPETKAPPFIGVAHNALDDAVYQAKHLMAIMKDLQCP